MKALAARRSATGIGLVVGAILVVALAAWLLVGGRATPPEARRLPVRITAGRGGTPRYAVPDTVARASGADVEDVARTVATVLRDDLAFGREFDVIPADICRLVPAADPSGTLPFADWRQVGADGLVATLIQKEGDTIRVAVRLYRVATGELAFDKTYDVAPAAARQVAHEIADAILWSQAGLRGVARTRIAFVSDRNGARRSPTGEMRRVKEIFASDYDGANQGAITADGDLALTPNWAPDGRAIAYTSYRRGFQDVFISLLAERRLVSPTGGYGKNWLPAWSPDGTRIAFTSSREGTESVYVMNVDGSGAHRLGHHWGIDTSPAWSPTGSHLAFTSNRSGSPQIWIMDADGSNPRQVTSEKYCDRPSWSPLPYNEIAYVSRTSTGFDIKVIDVATGRQRQLTFGAGFNESPAWSPNGRHIAFSSTRSGGEQIWTMARTGADLRPLTRIGNNSMPAWSGGGRD